MRVSFAVATLIGTFAASAAEAHDFSGRTGYHPTYAVRAPYYVVYDAEPGIRAYWARPWQGRHYYPSTGKKPKVGRLENLNAPRRVYKPTPTYYEEWSTLSLYPPRAAMPPADVESSAAPFLPAK